MYPVLCISKQSNLQDVFIGVNGLLMHPQLVVEVGFVRLQCEVVGT